MTHGGEFKMEAKKHGDHSPLKTSAGRRLLKCLRGGKDSDLRWWFRQSGDWWPPGRFVRLRPTNGFAHLRGYNAPILKIL